MSPNCPYRFLISHPRPQIEDRNSAWIRFASRFIDYVCAARVKTTFSKLIFNTVKVIVWTPLTYMWLNANGYSKYWKKSEGFNKNR